jgi:hypothetical protein
MITGIVASTSGILPAFTDEFVGSNGSSLPSKWSNIRGAWSIQSNKAATYSAANTYPLTTFNANTKNVNLRANYGELSGGWGVAFWVQDANNWWAVVSEKTSSFGCGSDVNNGDGTCYVTPYSYSYIYDCSYTTPVIEATCGPNRSQDILNNALAGCGGYDAGGYYCGNVSGYLIGINGCCYYQTYRGAAVYYGLPSGLTCEARCPGPCGPGGALQGTGCYGLYTTCPYIPATILQYNPASGGVYVPQTCTGTATGGGNTYTATTYYTTSIKLIKMEGGVASQVATIGFGATTDNSIGVSYINVVTNDAGQITATAQMSNGGAVAQIQNTPSSPTRATRHGVIAAPVASGTQATTAENLVYSPA